MNYEDQIRKILGSQMTLKSVTAGAILDVLEDVPSEEEKIKLLGIVFVERDSVHKQPSSLEFQDPLTSESWELLNRKYFGMSGEFVKATYFSTNSIGDSSREIFRFISFFKEKEERVFILATILFNDNFIPYMRLSSTPIKFSEKMINHLLESNEKQYDLMKHIVDLPFGTNHEGASILLKVFDENESNNSLRIALMAAYVSLTTEKISRVLKESRQKK